MLTAALAAWLGSFDFALYNLPTTCGTITKHEIIDFKQL